MRLRNRISEEHRDSFNATGNVLIKINGGLIHCFVCVMYHIFYSKN